MTSTATKKEKKRTLLLGFSRYDRFYIRAILLLVLAFNLTAAISLIYTKKFDVDEFQHAHIMWDLLHGKMIYRDFFDNHGALFAFFSSALFWLFHYQPAVETLFFLRLQSFVWTLFILFLTFNIARVVTGSNLCGLFAAALLSGFDVFIGHAIEIRPDGLQNIFMLSGVYLFLKYLEDRNFRTLFICGLLWGLSILTNAKGLLALAGCAFFVGFDAYRQGDFKKVLQQTGVFAGGVLITQMIAFFYFLSKSALPFYLYYNFIFNFQALSYAQCAVSSTLRAINTQPFFTLILFAGVSALLYSCRNERPDQRHHRQCLYVLTMSFTVIAFAFFHLWPHIFVSILPMLCIASAVGFCRLVRLRQDLSLSLQIAPVCIVLFALTYHASFPLMGLRSASKDQVMVVQLKALDYILKNTARTEPVLFFSNDGSAYVFNEDLHYYWTTLDAGYAKLYNDEAHREVLGADLVKLIEDRHVRYAVLWNNDFNTMPVLTRKYIQDHFKPMPFLNLYKKISP